MLSWYDWMGFGRDRVEFDERVTEDDLHSLVDDPDVRVVQANKPLPDWVWRLLNDVLFAKRPDLELRVFDLVSASWDLRFAECLTKVRHFAADCLPQATNLESLAAMPELESLSLGVYELTSFRVLEGLPPTLTSLMLHHTRSKKPSLTPLSRFPQLRTLYLEGQSNNIDVLADLANLEDLTLRSITTPDLRYLAPLTKLWSLDIKLGGIRSFHGIEGKECIKYLELWQIRNLREIGVLSRLPGLQNIFLDSLPHIPAVPSCAELAGLRRVHLKDLKGMSDFSALERAPALEDFLLIGKRQSPAQLLPVLRNPSVRRASAYFGSNAKNQEFERLRDEYGKVDIGKSWRSFEYR